MNITFYSLDELKKFYEDKFSTQHQKDFDAVIPILQKQIADLEDKIKIYNSDHSKLALTIADLKTSISNIKQQFQKDVNNVLSNIDNQIASLNTVSSSDLEQARNNLLAQISSLKEQVNKLPTNSIKSLKWTKISNDNSSLSVNDNLLSLYLDSETDSNNYIQKKEKVKYVEIKTITNNKEKITHIFSNGVKEITPLSLWREE